MSSLELGLSLTAAFISSVLGYYVICKYADLADELKHPSNWKHYKEDPLHSGTVTEKKLKYCGLFKILLSGLVYFVIEVTAAAFLTVSSLVPFKFLFFFYASIFRVFSDFKKEGENITLISLIVFIFLFVVSSIYVSPKNDSFSYPTRLQNEFNGYTLSYWVPVTIFIALFYFISRDDKATNLFAKYFGFGVCCTHFTYKDIQSLLKATLAGLVGGQALALVRIVSEAISYVVEVENDDAVEEIELDTVRPYLLLGVTIFLSGIHVYFIHRGLADLSIINVSLFMPIYVLCFTSSSLTCSLLYLREFSSLPSSLLAVYIVCFFALFFIALLLAVYSLSPRGPTKVIQDNSRHYSVYEDAVLDERIFPDLNKRRNTLWKLTLDKEYDSYHTELALSHTNKLKLDFSHKNCPYYNTDAKLFDFKYDISEHSLLRPKNVKNPYTLKDNVSMWEESGNSLGKWRIRGKNYLKDRVKVPSEVSRMQLVNVDWLFLPKNRVECISRLKQGFVQTQQVGKNRPFMLIINFVVPSLGNSVFYFVPRAGIIDLPFSQQLTRFVEHEKDSYRNDRFKLIPGVEKGNYIVRKFVGNTPAIIGRKLTTKYFKGENWFEISIDVGSSQIGKSIMGSVKGFATTLVLNLAFLLEGKNEQELPERMIGGSFIYYPIMKPYKEYKLNPSSIAIQLKEVAPEI